MGLLKRILGLGPKSHAELVRETAETIHSEIESRDNASVNLYVEVEGDDPDCPVDGSVRGVIDKIDRSEHWPDLIVEAFGARKLVIEVETEEGLTGHTDHTNGQLDDFVTSTGHSLVLVVSEDNKKLAQGFIGKNSSERTENPELATPETIVDKL